MQTHELIAALSRPQAYSSRAARIDTLQTHISILFFADERVYKVKKPLDLGFLDYSTLQRRRHFCEEEVRLNRRLAPDVYLGVARIVRGRCSGEVRIISADARDEPRADEELIECAVEMRRLPARDMLDAMLDRREVRSPLIDRIAALLASFHRTCATGAGVDEYAAPEELLRQSRENFAQLAPFINKTIPSMFHARLREWCERFLDEHAELMRSRLRDGRVREGHGDLHAGNICIADDRIVIYDCIEFSPRFRCRDVACEIAFLAMDLEARGGGAFARRLVRRYARMTDDPTLPDVLPFYMAHLAIVRAKVASLRSGELEIGAAERDTAAREARRYAHLAAAYAVTPALVITCGLPGSGKSWAARALMPSLRPILLRSDVIRKSLTGFAPTARPRDPVENERLYSSSMTERTYGALLAAAGRALARGRNVIADAVFATSQRRAKFIALAREMNVPCAILFAEAPDAVIRERMAVRASDQTEVSDADWQVYLRQREGFRPPAPAEAPVAMIGPDTVTDDVVGGVLEAMLKNTP